MSVRTYSPSVRVGNWQEDICLEEDQLKDFLDKRDKGELLVQKSHNLLETILKPVPLSKSSDGFVHHGDTVCLMHTPTKSLLSAYMSAERAHEATRLLSPSGVVCSKRAEPCSRNIFVIGSYDDPEVKTGDALCYGQYITLQTLPNIGGELYLQSDRATFMKHSRYTREQEVTLEEELSFKSAWRVTCFDPEDRLEKEGEPVPANQKLLINHCKTNQHLAVHPDFCPRTPFGREYEVSACTKFNIHKMEDTQNHFMLVMSCNSSSE